MAKSLQYNNGWGDAMDATRDENERLRAEVAQLTAHGEAWRDSAIACQRSSAGFAAEADRLRAEVDALKSLSERLKQEAQIHAQEARTANATIAECYQAVTNGKGEPGNWHGAKPVRDCIEALRADALRFAWFSDYGVCVDMFLDAPKRVLLWTHDGMFNAWTFGEAIDAARAAQGDA